MVNDRDELVQLQYVLSGGLQCPACQGSQLQDGGPLTQGDKIATQSKICSCGYVFEAVYELKGFKNA